MGWFGPQSGGCSCCDQSGGDCCEEGTTVTQITFTISGSGGCGGAINGTYVYDVEDCVFASGNAIEVVDFSGVGGCASGTQLRFTCNLAPVGGGAGITEVFPPSPPSDRLFGTTSELCAFPVSGTDILGVTRTIALTKV